MSGDAVEARVREYIAAVEADDLEGLDRIYAPEFENLRIDHHGGLIRLERDVFLGLLAQWRSDGGHPLPTATETILHPTSYFPGYAASLLTRVKAGQSLAYVLLWRAVGDEWLLVREFTVHEALPTSEHGPDDR